MNTALFVGSGAVENAWNPVIRALQPFVPRATLTEEGANTFLANIVYSVRFAYTYDNSEAREAASNAVKAVKLLISREIAKAQLAGELKIREQFAKVFKQMVLPDTEKLVVISTNWDTIVDEQIRKMPIGPNPKPVLHIHGIFTNPDRLYLPTEIIEEPYRSNDDKNELGNNHAVIMRLLIDCTKIVIYGLSLSPLDAELLQVLSVGCQSEIKKQVIIIDPKHIAVCEKINLILRASNDIIIKGYSPEDLDNRV